MTRRSISKHTVAAGRFRPRLPRGLPSPPLAAASALLLLLEAATASAHGWLREEGHPEGFHEEQASDSGAPPTPGLFAEELAMPDTFGVGVVADDVGVFLPRLEALATWLSDRLGPLGFARALPVVARDGDQMEEYLRAGIVELVSESPLAAVGLQERAGATPLLLEKRGGRAFAGSMLVVRRDSPLVTVADLAGQRVVLEPPPSTTGYVLPVALIRQAGLRAVHMQGRDQSPPADVVALDFSRDPNRDPFDVAGGVLDAAVMGDVEWRQFQAREPAVAGELRVLAETGKVPRGLLMTAPGLDAARRILLEGLLLHAADEGPGKAMLERYGDLAGFDPLGEGFDEQMRVLRELRGVLGDEAH